MKTVAHLIRQSGLSTAEARALLAQTLGVARETLVAHPELAVPETAVQAFEPLVTRRRAGEPLAYLLGEREFYGRVFRVTSDVLIPRPETELLVDLVLAYAKNSARARILDLGTGSGCIAISLSLERPDAEVTAVDRSESALAVARENADRLGARVTFLQGDWYSAVEGCFGFIAANPPYVAEADPHLADLEHEPRDALVAPEVGLACLRTIIGDAPPHLATDGWLFVEHGCDQAAAVRNLFTSAGFKKIETVRDAANLERVTLGTLPR